MGKIIIVSPSGSSDNVSIQTDPTSTLAQKIANPVTLASAVAPGVLADGDKVRLRGGLYADTDSFAIRNNATGDAVYSPVFVPVRIERFPGDGVPILQRQWRTRFLDNYIVKDLRFLHSGSSNWMSDNNQGSSYWTFINCEFDSTTVGFFVGMLWGGGSNLKFIRCSVERWQGGDAFGFFNCENIEFVKCNFGGYQIDGTPSVEARSGADHSMITFENVRDSYVDHCYFRNPWDRAITFTWSEVGQKCRNIVVENSVFVDCDWDRVQKHPGGTDEGAGECVRFGCTDSVFRNNVIMGTQIGRNTHGPLEFSIFGNEGQNDGSKEFFGNRIYNTVIDRNRGNCLHFNVNDTNLNPDNFRHDDNKFRNLQLTHPEEPLEGEFAGQDAMCVRIAQAHIEYTDYMFSSCNFFNPSNTLVIQIKGIADPDDKITLAEAKTDFPDIFFANNTGVDPIFVDDTILASIQATPEDYGVDEIGSIHSAMRIDTGETGDKDGVELTTISIAASSGATIIDVVDAKWFHTNSELHREDKIILGGDTYAIVAIDYSTHRLTLRTPLLSSVSIGDKVYLEAQTTTPNVGLFDAVGVANQFPFVNAGGDTFLEVHQTLVPTSSVSDDGLPAIPGTTAVSWAKISGPGNVTFDPDNTQVSPEISFSAPGTYVLRLTADDGELDDYDEATITVNPSTFINQAPSVSLTLPSSPITDSPAVPISAIVNDDGLPNPPGALTTIWTDVTGGGGPPPPSLNLLFKLGHNSPVDLSEYDDTASKGTPTHGIDAAVSASVPTGGAGGLKLSFEAFDGTDYFIHKDITDFTTELSYRFYINKNTIALDEGRTIVIIAGVKSGGQREQTIRIRKISGVISLQARIQNDSNSEIATAFYTLGSGDHWVDVLIKQAVSSSSFDGKLHLYIDGVKKEEINNIDLFDNPLTDIVAYRIGAQAIGASDVSAASSLHLDEFEFRKAFEVIGPLPVESGGGSGDVTFDNDLSISTVANFAAPGTYTLRLTADDGSLSSFDEDDITLDPAAFVTPVTSRITRQFVEVASKRTVILPGDIPEIEPLPLPEILSVFLRHNWDAPVTIESAFLTDLTESAGTEEEIVEQRRSLADRPSRLETLRLTALRKIDAQRLILTIARFGSSRQPIPVFCDLTLITQASSGTTLFCKTSLRRFFTGSRVLIHSWDAKGNPNNVAFATINGISSDRLTLTTSLSTSYPVNSRIYPVMDCELTIQAVTNSLTDECLDMTLQFKEIPGASALPAFVQTTFENADPAFKSIFEMRPNYAELQRVGIIRQARRYNQGRSGIVESRGLRPKYTFSLNFFAPNRDLAFDIIRLFESRRGQWLSFMMISPVTLFEEVNISGTTLTVLLSTQIEDLRDFLKYVGVVFQDGSQEIIKVASVSVNGLDADIILESEISAGTIKRITSAHLVRWSEDSLREVWSTDNTCNFLINLIEPLEEIDVLIERASPTPGTILVTRSLVEIVSTITEPSVRTTRQYIEIVSTGISSSQVIRVTRQFIEAVKRLNLS